MLDIDECEEGVSGCDQICTNNNGSYVCSCMDGYDLDMDNQTCNGQCLISSLYYYYVLGVKEYGCLNFGLYIIVYNSTW